MKVIGEFTFCVLNFLDLNDVVSFCWLMAAQLRLGFQIGWVGFIVNFNIKPYQSLLRICGLLINWKPG